MLGPFTGPVASIGTDQLHWAQFFANNWNKTHKLQLTIVQGDTQLDPAKASVVAQSMASNSSIVGIIGPAGSQEVTAVAPIFKKAGLAFISGSATNVSLTDGKLRGYFFRVVPNDGVQAPTAADYMMKKLGAKKGTTVMIVDDQESYSTGLADIVGNVLKKAGVTVDRESVSQKATDFSSLVAKVGGSTKVVFLPFQLASQAQLFAQQLKSQGKSAVVVRQRRHVRLEEVQRERELRLVLRSRRDDDPGQQGHRRRVQQGVPGRHEPVRRSELRGRAALRDGGDGGVQGRQDHPHRAPPGGREGEARLDDPRRADVVHRERRRRRREVLRVQDRGGKYTTVS